MKFLTNYVLSIEYLVNRLTNAIPKIFISPGGNAVISYILLLFLSGNNLSSASNWASFDICSAALIKSALK